MNVPAHDPQPSDAVLLATCEIANDILTRAAPGYRFITDFSLLGGAGADAAGSAEVLAAGRARAYRFRPRISNPYLRSTTPPEGADDFGLAVIAGITAAQRDETSAGASVPTLMSRHEWAHETSGRLEVATFGFSIQRRGMTFDWVWSDVERCEVVGLHSIIMLDRHDKVVRRVHSEWAELIFVLWALARNPWNLQLINGTWLPSHWRARATQQGLALQELALPALARVLASSELESENFRESAS